MPSKLVTFRALISLCDLMSWLDSEIMCFTSYHLFNSSLLMLHVLRFLLVTWLLAMKIFHVTWLKSLFSASLFFFFCDSVTGLSKTNDYCAVPLQLKDQLNERYSGARRAYLKTGGDFPFLSRPDEVNLHLQVNTTPCTIFYMCESAPILSLS